LSLLTLKDPPSELPVVGSGKPIMIFGIDMSQTAEGKGGCVAAVVGSMDNNFTEYVSFVLILKVSRLHPFSSWPR
jgi:hypothetical protein